MVAANLERSFVHASDHEVLEIQAIDSLLRRLQDQSPLEARARLVGVKGEEVDLPRSVYALLQQIVPLLLEGDSIAVVPYHKEMTTQEAADFLNISRQYLTRLLDGGVIPHTKVGTHRRVRFRDIAEYKVHRHSARKASLARMTALAEEAGDYE